MQKPSFLFRKRLIAPAARTGLHLGVVAEAARDGEPVLELDRTLVVVRGALGHALRDVPDVARQRVGDLGVLAQQLGGGARRRRQLLRRRLHHQAGDGVLRAAGVLTAVADQRPALGLETPASLDRHLGRRVGERQPALFVRARRRDVRLDLGDRDGRTQARCLGKLIRHIRDVALRGLPRGPVELVQRDDPQIEVLGLRRVGAIPDDLAVLGLVEAVLQRDQRVHRGDRAAARAGAVPVARAVQQPPSSAGSAAGTTSATPSASAPIRRPVRTGASAWVAPPGGRICPPWGPVR